MEGVFAAGHGGLYDGYVLVDQRLWVFWREDGGGGAVDGGAGEGEVDGVGGVSYQASVEFRVAAW